MFLCCYCVCCSLSVLVEIFPDTPKYSIALQYIIKSLTGCKQLWKKMSIHFSIRSGHQEDFALTVCKEIKECFDIVVFDYALQFAIRKAQICVH